jgi:hypothetical protein
MPKGRTTPRELVCKSCERPFVTDRMGRAAFYCRREDCPREMALREAEARRAANREARETRQATAASRRAARFRRDRAIQLLREDDSLVASVLSGIRPGRSGTPLDPILKDPDQMMMYRELLEIAPLAVEAAGEKGELARAVVQLHHAEGVEGAHTAWQRIAAIALKASDQGRPRMGRYPDETLPHDAEEDGDSLAA